MTGIPHFQIRFRIEKKNSNYIYTHNTAAQVNVDYHFIFKNDDNSNSRPTCSSVIIKIYCNLILLLTDNSEAAYVISCSNIHSIEVCTVQCIQALVYRCEAWTVCIIMNLKILQNHIKTLNFSKYILHLIT